MLEAQGTAPSDIGRFGCQIKATLNAMAKGHVRDNCFGTNATAALNDFGAIKTHLKATS